MILLSTILPKPLAKRLLKISGSENPSLCVAADKVLFSSAQKKKVPILQTFCQG